MRDFELGQMVRVRVTVRDPENPATPVDPTSVQFRFGVLGQTTVTYNYGSDAAVVKDSVGVYHVDWSITVPIRHKVRVLTTGLYAGSVTDQWNVTDPGI